MLNCRKTWFIFPNKIIIRKGSISCLVNKSNIYLVLNNFIKIMKNFTKFLV